MFTLEESALLGRMLRTLAVLVVCAIVGLGYVLVRAYAAPATKPPSVSRPQHAHFVPAHRHHDPKLSANSFIVSQIHG
jgi:hypothetical protein